MTANETEMTRRVEVAASALSRLADDAQARCGGLTAEQLNWRPVPDRWIVAQCFDHLVKVQSDYLPALRRLADGTASPTLWERLSPFSGSFGTLLIRSLSPDNERKTKTIRKMQPSASDLDGRVIARFAGHQRELVAAIRALPAELDPRRVIVTSPLSPFVTYSLADALTILVVHGQRHFLQAERVLGAEGFPG